MPTVVGTPVRVFSTLANGNVDIAVPADAEAAVVFRTHWHASNTFTNCSLEISGNPVNFMVNDLITGNSGGFVGYLEGPDTGATVNFAWAYSGTMSYIGPFYIIFLQDVNAGDIFNDWDVITSGSGADATVACDSAEVDLVLGYTSSFGRDPASDIDTIIGGWDNDIQGSAQSDVGSEEAVAGTTSIATTDGNFSFASIISLNGIASTLTASGTPSVDSLTVNGVVDIIKRAIGIAVVPEITASGVSTVIKKTTGVVTLAAITAVGVAQLAPVAFGTPVIDELIAIGISTIIKPVGGSPVIEELTASGVSDVITAVLVSNGSPTLSEIAASGISNVISPALTANGNPILSEITVSGLSNVFGGTEGLPTVSAIIASGVSTIIAAGELTSTGVPIIATIIVAGISTIHKRASGTITIEEVVAAGIANATSISIIDVNTTESWEDGDIGIVITGTGFI